MSMAAWKRSRKTLELVPKAITESQGITAILAGNILRRMGVPSNRRLNSYHKLENNLALSFQ